MKTYSIKQQKSVILHGFKDGIPISLGYFAVAFSLGIAAKNAGISIANTIIIILFISFKEGSNRIAARKYGNLKIKFVL